MGPDHRTRVPRPLRRPRHQRVERRHHVGVAKVPRFHLAGKHRAVVLLRITNQPGILLGEEVFVLGDPAVTARVIGGRLPHVHQLRDNVVFTRLGEAERRRIAVTLCVVGSKQLEATVPAARARRAFGVDLAEVLQNRLDRRMKAVQIEAIKTGAIVSRPLRVVCAKPLQEVDHDRVSPHPARKTCEVAERRRCIGFAARVAHPPVYAVRIGPVRLGRDDVELFGLDEGGREVRADAIELIRAVRRLTDQNQTRIADEIEQRRKAVHGRREPERGMTNGVEGVAIIHGRAEECKG